MNGDSDIYFTHANASSSVFFFCCVRNVGMVKNEVVLPLRDGSVVQNAFPGICMTIVEIGQRAILSF